MTQFITNIITFSVSLFFNAMKIIPKMTPELLTEAWTSFKQAGDEALAAYVAAPTESTAVQAEDMIHDGLQIVKNSLDEAGVTKADMWIDEADTFDVALEKGSSPFIALIKAGWQKVFGKKATPTA